MLFRLFLLAVCLSTTAFASSSSSSFTMNPPKVSFSVNGKKLRGTPTSLKTFDDTADPVRRHLQSESSYYHQHSYPPPPHSPYHHASPHYSPYPPQDKASSSQKVLIKLELGEFMDDESKKEGKDKDGYEKEAMDYANILIDVEKKENKNSKKPEPHHKDTGEEGGQEEYGAKDPYQDEYYPMPRESGLEIYSIPVKEQHSPNDYTKIIVVVDEKNEKENKHIETKLEDKKGGDSKESKGKSEEKIMVVIDVLEEEFKKYQKEEEKMKAHGVKHDYEHKKYDEYGYKEKDHKLLDGKITIKKPGKAARKGHLKDYYKEDAKYYNDYEEKYEYGEKEDKKYEYGEKEDKKYDYGEKEDKKYDYGEKEDEYDYGVKKGHDKYKKTVYLEKDKDFYEKYKEDGYDASGVQYLMANLDWDKICD